MISEKEVRQNLLNELNERIKDKLTPASELKYIADALMALEALNGFKALLTAPSDTPKN